MGLKIIHARRWVVVAAMACVLLSAALPLAFSQQISSNCPSAPLIKSLKLNSDCSYSTYGIELAANGITLNCAGHKITYTGTLGQEYYGIYSEEADAVANDTVKNCNLSGGWYYGIYLYDMHGLTLTGNTVAKPSCSSSDCEYGIYLEYVGPATVSANTVTTYDYAFELYYVNGITLSGNTATGTGSNDYGFYVKGYGYNLVFTGNTASGFSGIADAGFFLYESGLEYSGPGGSLTGNTANGNLYGFATQDASGFTFKDNTANSNTQYGFVDYTYGPGTLGLGNTYISNSCTGNGSYGSYDGYLGFGPAYLCTPQG